MELDPALAEVMELLNTFFQENNVQYVVFGAVVPMLLIELKDKDGIGYGIRQTKDLDCVLQIESWREYGRIQERLLEKGFTRKAGEPEHRLFFRDFPVDLIPYGTAITRENVLTWPVTENQMNVPGFEFLFRYAKQVDISDRLSIPMIPLSLAVYTKILAFQSRKLKRDLTDILYILTHYEEIQFSERRYEAGVPGDLPYERRGAFLIGKDLRSILPNPELSQILPFLKFIDNPHAPELQAAIRDFRMDIDDFVSTLKALQDGLRFAE